MKMRTVRAFQFTRPRGARRLTVIGGDNRQGVSIHAPTRGATVPPGACQCYRVSIHAPTRGATSIIGSSIGSIIGFNSRAHAGRDMAALPCRWTQCRFNSRAHAGRDTGILRNNFLW